MWSQHSQNEGERKWSWKDGSRHFCDHDFMKSQNSHLAMQETFVLKKHPRLRTVQQKKVIKQRNLTTRFPPPSDTYQQGFHQKCWVIGGGVRASQLLGSFCMRLVLRNIHRIIVLHGSSLGYLVFTWWLVLIRGTCHVQRPLLSSASVCPYVISLFKLCLWLCQVLTVALSTTL